MLRSKWFLPSVALTVVLVWLAWDSWGRSSLEAPKPSSVASSPEERKRIRDRLKAAPPAPSIDTRPAESAVAEIRQRSFVPEPRQLVAPQIAVSGARVGRLKTDAVVVVEPGSKRAALELPLPGALQIVAIPGGLLAIGKHQLVRLDNQADKPRLLPRVTLFPGSTIVPDLIQRDRIWVRHSSMNTLYGYGLEAGESSLLPIVATLQLHGNPSGLFLGLPDGSFVDRTDGKWERLFAQGKRFELAAPSHAAPAFRSLRARRLDQFFVLYRDGLIQRLQIADKLRVVWSRELGELPIDIASFGDSLVLLRTRRAAAGDLEWFLEVVHTKAPSKQLELGASTLESFKGEWYRHQLFTRGLAASLRFIALGGGDELEVWDADDLRPVHVPAERR